MMSGPWGQSGAVGSVPYNLVEHILSGLETEDQPQGSCYHMRIFIFQNKLEIQIFKWNLLILKLEFVANILETSDVLFATTGLWAPSLQLLACSVWNALYIPPASLLNVTSLSESPCLGIYSRGLKSIP